MPWLAYASLAGSMALVGSYVGLSRLLVAAFPVFLLAWLRFGIAAVAMLHWVRRRDGEPVWVRVTAYAVKEAYHRTMDFIGGRLNSITMKEVMEHELAQLGFVEAA
mgnify:CR=1 FL=1